MFGGASAGMSGFNGNCANGFNRNGASGFGQQTRFGAQCGNVFGGISVQGARGNFGRAGNNGFVDGQPGFEDAVPASGKAIVSEKVMYIQVRVRLIISCRQITELL